jgi:hypothetical protein
MPFIGSASTQGSQATGAITTVYSEVIVAADSMIELSKPLSLNGISRVTLLVVQTTGAIGQFALVTRPQGVTPTRDYPIVPIAALNMPVQVTFHVAVRSAVVAVHGPPAGGPHTYTVTIMGTGTS